MTVWLQDEVLSVVTWAVTVVVRVWVWVLLGCVLFEAMIESLAEVWAWLESLRLSIAAVQV